MKALQLTEFGEPDVLSLVDVDDPTPGPDTVVVRVVGSGVNPVDHKIVAGHLRGAFPHFPPIVPGWDVAGEVVAVGPAVTEHAEGDPVVGYVRKDHLAADGTFAELVAAHPRHLAAAPTTIDLTDAAGLPLAGLTALQSLRLAEVGPGDVVLVNNAGGGVGSFAVQIATGLGATVLGTGSPGSADHLQALGARPVAYGDGLEDRVRDAAPDGLHAALDYAGTDEALDVGFALVADPSRVVSITDPSVLGRGGRYCFVRPDRADLAHLAEMVDRGELGIPVAETFALEDGVAALRRNAEGHVKGKVVISGR